MFYQIFILKLINKYLILICGSKKAWIAVHYFRVQNNDIDRFAGYKNLDTFIRTSAYDPMGGMENISNMFLGQGANNPMGGLMSGMGGLAYSN